MFPVNEKLRFWFPIASLFLFSGYVCYKLVKAHVAPEPSVPRYEFERELVAERGSIYASDGKESTLARSVPYWEYHLDPVALTNAVVTPKLGNGKRGAPREKAAILKTISYALKLDYAKVKAMGDNTSNRYQYLALSSDQNAHAILSDPTLVAGVAIEDQQIRQYLQGRRLAHVIGSVNSEGIGSSGLEQVFNRELTGTPGVVKGKKDARGREIYDKREISIAPKRGADIYLTIDQNIQYETEAHLKWGIRTFGAASGWVIVMNAKTGAVYAMASYPDFDPLAFGHASDDEKVNRAVAFNFEPGSVMKVLTVAAAIDASPKRYKPETMYSTDRFDKRYYKLPGDAHGWSDSMITLKTAIVKSSNIVIGKLAYDIGPKVLFDYFSRFGMGQKTGIELPGEQYGILPDPNKKMWDKASWSRAGIGQFVAVTPIQLIGAYQAIANDGVRMKPYLVDRIVDADGKVLRKSEPVEVARPISAKTARVVRDMMREVATKNGTARAARITGYSIAGKTGTAQKVEKGRYAAGLYRASFCGMIPCDNPEIVILASLDFDRKVLKHTGGNTAAHVFKRVALTSIRYLGIQPDKPEEIEESDGVDEYEKMQAESENSATAFVR